MIEIEYIYIKKNNVPVKCYAYFHHPEKAVRFIYKCIHSKNMAFTGDFTCDDPIDTAYINRRLK